MSSLMLFDRVLADSRNRDDWKAKRVGRIGASDAAGFAKVESAPLYLKAKLHNTFDGNAYTVHGNGREARMLEHFAIPQNTLLFHHPENVRHVATPDGLWTIDGEIFLAQCKTSLHPAPRWDKIPARYKRQMWWEQYVMGAVRTVLVWEQHYDFRPVDMEPKLVWFERDDAEISKLITIANFVLDGMDAAEAFTTDMKGMKK
jgi:hypothetical protein